MNDNNKDLDPQRIKISEPNHSGVESNVIQDTRVSTNNRPKFNRFIRNQYTNIRPQMVVNQGNDKASKIPDSEKPTTATGNPSKMFECNKCNYKTILQESLLQHTEMKHGKNDQLLFDKLRYTYLGEIRVYQCDRCDYHAGRKKMLTHHLLHNKEYEFQCDECNYKTFDERSLTQHNVKHTEDILPSLKIVNAAKKSEVNYYEKKRRNFKWSDKYEDYQDKKYDYRDEKYDDYQDKEYEDKKYADKKYEGKKYEDKKYEDKKYEDKKYEDKKYGDKKYEDKNKEDLSQHKVISSAEILLCCFHCNYKTADMQTLLKHMKTHPVEDKPAPGSKIDYGTTKEIYKSDQFFYCDQCIYKTFSRTKLSDHISMEHSSKKMFDCFQCNYKALDQNDIVKHYLKTHTKQNLFDCNKTSLSPLEMKMPLSSSQDDYTNLSRHENNISLSIHHDNTNLYQHESKISGSSRKDDIILDHESKMPRFIQPDDANLAKRETKMPISSQHYSNTSVNQRDNKISESNWRDDDKILNYESKMSRFNQRGDANLTKWETKMPMSSQQYSDVNITKRDSGQTNLTQRKRKLSSSSQSDDDLNLAQRESKMSKGSRYDSDTNLAQPNSKISESIWRDDKIINYESKISRFNQHDDSNLTKHETKMPVSSQHYSNTSVTQHDNKISESSWKDDDKILNFKSKMSRFSQRDDAHLMKRETKIPVPSQHYGATNITQRESKIYMSSHDGQTNRTQHKRKSSSSSESDDDLYSIDTHHESRKSERSKLVEDIFTCFQCDFNAPDMKSVVSHIRKMHTDMKPYISDDPDDAKNELPNDQLKVSSPCEERTFQCFQCDYKAADMTSVIEHIKQKHP